MSGTVRFDDENIVKFVLDAENEQLHVVVILAGVEHEETVNLGLS